MGESVDKLLSLVESLGAVERRVLKYFFENISVGEIKAVEELKHQGVEEPEEVISRLVELGLLEEGVGCYNLSAPLRDYVRRRGVPRELLA
ncbi:PolB1-binding protein PBP2 family protein [Aeropyrum camini]|uniref:Uncharacterized protein n=1 Tax=Aeropyrum camini SY1 = JCM 12091 TaxID=1198449 RepID=U3TC80_9CREN|nr:hypothetical protein [Aeropyrum camini]BAN90041.1 hypothetical protein ACAM_0572 [Aeropyrum camini SY1 = JCM 12091]